ncbi:MAG TPA: hypothetical protein VFR18_01105 [Terriglobia bacterium]|nr:hypothetical protein [Terriglobia bacterium]HEU5135643.1 hypothetical protein [Steroidobacteraceae bacterium]
MRTRLTVVLSVLAAAAPGQESLLSDTEADIRWEKLMIITNGESDAEQLQHLRSHGMGDEGAKALLTFRTTAMREMNNVFRQLYQELCARQKELRETGGPEMVAQIIEQQKLRESATRRRLLAEANSLLSAVDQERLEHLYTSDHGPNVQVHESGTAARVRNGQLPVEQAISRSCELAKISSAK